MYFKRMGVRPGVADYLALTLRSKAAIEIKDKDGKQRKGQEKFERDWKAAGGVYIVVRTLQEFKSAVQALVLFG